MTSNNLNSNLRSFSLTGLHGYKDLSIDCMNNAAIVLAENGVGKTTLLDTLYALLSGRISRLASLTFSEARLQFTDKEVVFSRELAFKALDPTEQKTLLGRKPARDLLEFVSAEQLSDLLRLYAEGSKAEVRRHPALQRIHRTSPWDFEEIFARLDRLRSLMYDNTYIAEFRKSVTEAMGGSTVLYLPTYRRIEATFDDFRVRRAVPQRLNLDDEERDADQLIYFGLNDVEEKVEKMTRFIQQSMYEAYARLSGNMLDAMLGMKQFELPLEKPLDLELVRVMLGRLGKSNSLTDAELENALKTTDATSEHNKSLTYFLRQLLRSYETSRPQELALENFVDVINGYFDTAQTDKRLRFNKEKLRVDIWHETLQTSLPFGSLSSGEKQIVSIFARLILEGEQRYIILIDEPELSLSIEWQRRFLLDILKTKSCAQLIAITHSPFVFENELDIFANSISVTTNSAKE